MGREGVGYRERSPGEASYENFAMRTIPWHREEGFPLTAQKRPGPLKQPPTRRYMSSIRFATSALTMAGCGTGSWASSRSSRAFESIPSGTFL
jgi:hypothetical protein